MLERTLFEYQELLLSLSTIALSALWMSLHIFATPGEGKKKHFLETS